MPDVAAANEGHEDSGWRSKLKWRILHISLCTGLSATACFVSGSLFGSVLGDESSWTADVLDFTNFLGILVLFLGMATAGCITLKLASQDRAPSDPPQYRVWASMPFRAITMGAAPPTFQSYVVHAGGRFDWHAPAIMKKESDEITRPCRETVSCPCCLAEFEGTDMVAVLPCGHFFCEPCIAGWASSRSSQSSSCPLCRLSFDGDMNMHEP
mmetsp:Transcript_8323/g.15116  ORF Transcript_8323/g.15116 Transcript_8323/m.15116 type:complete len:212 (-) Transcript_8323:97-732(-)